MVRDIFKLCTGLLICLGGRGGSGGVGGDQGGDGGTGQGPTVYFGQPQAQEPSGISLATGYRHLLMGNKQSFEQFAWGT